jgi:hypothetical protein
MYQYYNGSNSQVALPNDEQGYLPGFDVPDRTKCRRVTTGDLCERIAAAVYGGQRHQKTRTYGINCHTDLVNPRHHMEVKSNNKSERFYLRNDQVFRYLSIVEKYGKTVYLVLVRWKKTKKFREADTVRGIETALFESLSTVIRIPIMAFLPAITTDNDARIYRPARERFSRWYSSTWVQSSNVRQLEEDPTAWLTGWGLKGYKVARPRRAVLLYREQRSTAEVVNISISKTNERNTLGEYFDELGDFYDDFTGAADCGCNEFEFGGPSDLSFDPLQF